jgi:hypothetical protein
MLGYLATRFTDRLEDFATEALGYILQNSPTAHRAFWDHLSTFVPNLPQNLAFRTQATGRQKGIPDLVGSDEAGRPRVIVEAKFWAGLTENQPPAYLDMLPADQPGLLIFIAPEARRQSLWPELKRRCPSASELKRFCLWIGPHRRYLAMTSWRDALNALEARLVQVGEEAARADVQQLRGLCERMDYQAFLPFSSEDFAPRIGRCIVQYYELLEELVRQLSSRSIARTGAYGILEHWRGRYIILLPEAKPEPKLVGFICVSPHAWARHRETPLWLMIRPWIGKPLEPQWFEEIRKALQPLEREGRLITDPQDPQRAFQVPLFLPTGVERDAVLSALVDQVRQVAELLRPLQSSA